MQLIIDNFDSKILKTDVYKLYLEEKIIEEQFTEKVKKIKKGIIFCFTDFSPENFTLLENLGFHLVSVRNIYKLDLKTYLKKEVSSFPVKYKILPKKETTKILKENNLIQLAQTIYQTSRYNKDNSLNKKLALDIYINWFKNSLYGDYADEAFLVFDGSSAAGIITIKIKDNEGFIDLLGVLGKYQNQNIATHLLKQGISYLLSRRIKDIFVTTEGENIPANVFYQKNNFILHKIEFAYHKHILLRRTK